MRSGNYAEYEAEEFLKKYIPVAKHILVNTAEEAESAALKIKFPLVMKIISQDALHKSEVDGVKIIESKEKYLETYKELVKKCKDMKIKLDGILIQEFVKGESVLIGLKKDGVFGHVIVFGIGGIYTELLKDVSFRVCPITLKDADEMINEIKMKEILFGFRGRKKVNIQLLKEALVSVSEIPIKNPSIVEMDINPFVINDKEGLVVDARILVE